MINKNRYDLEERTLSFAKNVRTTLKTLKYSITNSEDSKQLIRSSGSVGANYIEANEAISKKEFLYRIKLSRKEAKESTYFLKLLVHSNPEFTIKFEKLIDESLQLRNILTSILNKSQ